MSSDHRPKRKPEQAAKSHDYARGVEALMLPPRLKLLLHVIARACDENGVCTYLGRAHLAVACSCSEDHITRLLVKAKERGLLEVEGRWRQGGRRHNRYTLLLPPIASNDGILAQPDIQRSECATRHSASGNPTFRGSQPDPQRSEDSPEEESPSTDSPSRVRACAPATEGTPPQSNGTKPRPRTRPKPKGKTTRPAQPPRPLPQPDIQRSDSGIPYEAMAELAPDELRQRYGGELLFGLGFDYTEGGALIEGPDWYPYDRWGRRRAVVGGHE